MEEVFRMPVSLPRLPMKRPHYLLDDADDVELFHKPAHTAQPLHGLADEFRRLVQRGDASSTPAVCRLSDVTRTDVTADSGVCDLSFTTPPASPGSHVTVTPILRTHGLHRSRSRLSGSEFPHVSLVFDELSDNADSLRPVQESDRSDITADVSSDVTDSSASVTEEQCSVAERVRLSLGRILLTSPERLIGRRMGLGHVDMLGEMADTSHYGVVATILSHLAPRDLSALACVSTRHLSLVEGTPHARARLTSYKQSRRLARELAQKENVKLTAPAPRDVTGKATRQAFGRIQPLAETLRSAVVTSSIAVQRTPGVVNKDRSKLYWAEVARLNNDQSLRKCPRCQHPAHVTSLQHRALCSNRACALDFCVHCRQPAHGSRDCALSSPKKIRSDAVPVGSRKSKKHLRRL